MSQMSQEITNKVIEIVASQLEIEVERIKPESSFTDDLKADSLAVVELVLALEEAFGIEIPDEDTEKIKSVKDAILYIETHRN
jgi:acyl carrier protein